MGKGDKKTRRGKLFAGTYGVRRKRKSTETYKPDQKHAVKVQEKKVAKEVVKPEKIASGPKKSSKPSKAKETEGHKKTKNEQNKAP